MALETDRGYLVGRWAVAAVVCAWCDQTAGVRVQSLGCRGAIAERGNSRIRVFEGGALRGSLRKTVCYLRGFGIPRVVAGLHCRGRKMK